MKEDWLEVELGDITELNPKILNKNEIDPDLEVQFLPMRLVEEISNKVHLDEIRRFHEVQKKSYTYFSEEDVLFAKVTPCMENGKIAIAKGLKNNIGFGSSEFHVFRASKAVLNGYLFHFLVQESFRRNAQHEMTGAVGLRRVPKSYLVHHLFPLAPLPEQRAIVAKIEALFSEVDQGIADLKKAQDQLKVYRQAVLKKAFEGELTKEWREKQTDLPSADELLEQIKEERQKHYMQQLEIWKLAVKEWEENGKEGKKPGKPKKPNYFEELTRDELNGFNISGGYYTKMGNLSDVVRGGSPRPAGDERFYNGSIPFLKVADLTRKKGMYVDSYTYSIKEAGLQKTRMLEIGTLIISNSGATLGVPKITAIRTTANDGIAAFLGLNKNMSIFLYHYWNSKTLALRAIDQGAGQPNLNTDLLKAYPVPIFSYHEQSEIIKEIESRLSLCDQVEQSITESLEKAQALRQSILKKAFEGSLLSEAEIEKCKAEPDWEPAEVLLERIKTEKKE